MLSGSQVSAFGYLPFSTLTKKPHNVFFLVQDILPQFLFFGG